MGGYGFILILNGYSNIRELDETGSNGYNYDLNNYINSLSKIDYDELLGKIEVSNKDTTSKKISKCVNDIVDFFIELEEYGKLDYEYTNNKDELSIKLSYSLNNTTLFKSLLDDETFEIYKILSTAKKRIKSIGDLISYDHETFKGGYQLGGETMPLLNINIKIKLN